MNRNRPKYALLTACVIAAGLASRSELASVLPDFLENYAGDTLWALMVFLGFGFAFPRQSTFKVALSAMFFCLTIEFSQLYQEDWINRLRATQPGRLILGFGFRWSDLACYLTGVLFGAAAESLGGQSAKGRPQA